MSWRLRGIRLAFRALEPVSVRASGALAEQLFFRPPRARLPASAQPLLARARRSWLAVDAVSVPSWHWGEGPLVALAHGWGSRGGRLTSLVEPLLARGFSVVTFDAPGHGESDSRLGSIPQSARTLRALEAAAGPLHAVVGHSLGAAATALAVSRGLDLARAVFIAPPASPLAYVEAFARSLGVSAAVMAEMRRRSQERLRFNWEDLDVVAMAERSRGIPLLVVHDEGDREVLPDDGAAIAGAWPGARLVTTRGLGHHRITRDPDAIAQVVDFLAEGVAPRRPVPGLEASAETIWLERILFERESRSIPARL